MAKVSRRGFFGRAVGGFAAALGLAKVSKPTGCGDPGCFRPGCWTGPRPPRTDLDEARKRQAKAFADDWDAKVFREIYAQIYGPYGAPSK